MATNAFIGRLEPPTDADLTAALGPSKAVWDQLLAALAADCGANQCEWSSYSPKAGWSFRVKRKQRTIVWLSPSTGCFNAAFILGDKAVAAARQNKLPRRIIEQLDKAPKYPEGTGLRLEIKSATILPALRKLAAVKTAN